MNAQDSSDKQFQGRYNCLQSSLDSALAMLSMLQEANPCDDKVKAEFYIREAKALLVEAMWRGSLNTKN